MGRQPAASPGQRNVPADDTVEFIDTHCHLDFPPFAADRADVIQRALQAGVVQMVVVGADVASSSAAQELAAAYPGVLVATAGIHPHYAAEADDAEIQELSSLAQDARVRAIGEVGLDYFDHQQPAVLVADTIRQAQQRLLKRCIALARQQRLPLVLHCRSAGADMLRVIREEIEGKTAAVMHCFSEDAAFLEQILELGLFVSFTGNITYPRAAGLRDAVAAVPLDRLMLETDAPYLAPQAVRGQRNEPAHVRHIAAGIAELKKISIAEVARATTENARQFFKLARPFDSSHGQRP